MGVGKFLLAWLMLGLAPFMQAAEAPPIPIKPEAEQFKGDPAPWREYFIKARAAERIADPLQRCLAFPDLPDNHWPVGHAAAHCQHHFAVKRPTLDGISGLVERGEMAKLEAMFDQSLERHFATGDAFSDDIHDTFNLLLAGSRENERIGRVTEAWLRQAPDSAYAHLARGAYFNGAAWKARGTKFAADTPERDIRLMGETVEQAIPYFRKALAINPRLIAAYTGMIELGMIDSRPELETEGIQGAEKLDPACPELARDVMRALEPRWGGSYEQMLGYANKLSAYLSRRPELAIAMAAPFEDRSAVLQGDDQYDSEAQEVVRAGLEISSNEDVLRKAAVQAVNGPEKDGFVASAYLLQEARFRETSTWGMRQIAWTLRRYEPEWSLKYSLRSLELEPDSALGHYLAGAGYFSMRRYEDADREYRIAIEDGEQRQTALREAANMWLWQGDMQSPDIRKANATKARPYVDRLVSEYPDDMHGTIMAFWAGMFATQHVTTASMQAILKKIDRSDPWQASQASHIEAMLKQFDAANQQKQH